MIKKWITQLILFLKTLIFRFKNSISQLFFKPKKNEIKKEPVLADPGIKCPQCNFKIKVTIEQLLSTLPIYCTNCFLKLSIDNDKSAEALNALKKLNSDFQRANQIIKDHS